MRRLCLGLLALLTVALPQGARAAPAAANAAVELPVTDQVALGALVSFLAPRQMTLGMDLSSCEQFFRNSLSRMKGISEIEAEMPGVTEHMGDATAAYCAEHIPPIFNELWGWATIRSTQFLTTAEIRQLYPLIRDAAGEMDAIPWQIERGESASHANERLKGESDGILGRYREKSELFEEKPENVQVAGKLHDLQLEAAQRLHQSSSQISTIAMDAADAGLDAGNAFAVQRGLKPIFEN